MQLTTYKTIKSQPVCNIRELTNQRALHIDLGEVKQTICLPEYYDADFNQRPRSFSIMYIIFTLISTLLTRNKRFNQHSTS